MCLSSNHNSHCQSSTGNTNEVQRKERKMKRFFAITLAVVFLACFFSLNSTYAQEWKGLEILSIVKVKDVRGDNTFSFVGSRFGVPQNNISIYFAKAGLTHTFSRAFEFGWEAGFTSGFFDRDAILIAVNTKFNVSDFSLYGFSEGYHTLAGVGATFSGFGLEHNSRFHGRDLIIGFGSEVLSRFDHGTNYVRSNAWIGPHLFHGLGKGWDSEIDVWRLCHPFFDGVQGWSGRVMIKKTVDLSSM
ncbi:MAG TPA: hypothetical protein VJH92_02560 [Candidatus Nanoarchaeia archaeon]|nr:hypothetical protein [Candidatus Nanoarchaeia archaeon]